MRRTSFKGGAQGIEDNERGINEEYQYDQGSQTRSG